MAKQHKVDKEVEAALAASIIVMAEKPTAENAPLFHLASMRLSTANKAAQRYRDKLVTKLQAQVSELRSANERLAEQHERDTAEVRRLTQELSSRTAARPLTGYEKAMQVVENFEREQAGGKQ